MIGVRTANTGSNGMRNPFWVRILPFAIYMAFVALAPVLGDNPGGLDGRWVYAVKVGLVTLALGIFWRHYGELRPLRFSLGEIAAGLVAGLVVFVLWINLDLPWVSLMNDDTQGFDPRDATGRIDWALAAVRLAGAALVVPVMEELFWRSFIMRWIDRPNFLSLDPRKAGLRALLISSAIFGIEHQLWFAGILAGLVYGELYRRSGNLWLPILAHAVTNGALGLWVLSAGQWRFW